ncbi:MAG: MBL fold metallo-hydrolase RNA specificity domain-containing protein [Patescibacteria group bacterium]|jgi:metallo-beta-lactamase family protein
MKHQVKITFLGAAGGVTGSKHLLQLGKKKILLDCGFFQGRRLDAYRANSVLPPELNHLEAVILSHAHADHCCSLPLLVKNGYRGPIYTTPATADIARLIMLDAAKIQANDYEYFRKIGVTEALKPIFDEQDVNLVCQLFKTIPYHYPQKINPNLTIEFFDAGHILGSAITAIRYYDQTLLYTGDLGNLDLPILPDPELVTEEINTVICESTYGDREHLPTSQTYQEIKKIVIEAVNKKSRVLVPAFALGRTQNLIYILHKLYRDGEIPDIPVYVDSPLGNSITSLFDKYINDFDQESWQEFLKDGQSPFSFRKLHYVSTVAESRSLNDKPGPLIIIASSGMLEGGRVVHHLKQDITNPRSTIVLTGFQAEHTLGRRLESGQKTVKFHEEEFTVKAQIVKLNTLSAHADQKNILNYLSQVKGLKNIFLVHGEPQSARTLAEKLRSQNPEVAVKIPYLGESVQLDWENN